MKAIRSTRPGGHMGYVGVLYDVELPGEELFYSHVHLHGGPAPVRRFLWGDPGYLWRLVRRGRELRPASPRASPSPRA
jgi:hypothetical protein